jgi:hypothetical protein
MIMAEANVSRVDDSRGHFTYTQKGKKVLNYSGYLYHKNKSYVSKDTQLVLWECERRRDNRCSVYVTTDEGGFVVKKPTSSHIHSQPTGRADALTVRHNILEEATIRPDSAPIALLNEYVTPEVALKLGDDSSLKRAIQRKRKHNIPVDPPSANGIVIGESWAQTLDKQPWFLGEVAVGNDNGYIFATKDNLSKLNISVYL